MSGPVGIARRHRWCEAATVGLAVAGLALTAHAPGRSPERTAPVPPRAPVVVAPVAAPIQVADVLPPAALPAWATRPDRAPRRIAGRVVGERGEPIPAIVHLRLAERAELWRGLDVATDASGRFDFGELPAGAFALIAEAPGLGSRVTGVRTDGDVGIDDMAQDGGRAEVIVHPCAPFRGVVTAGGRAVIGARITHGGVTVAHSGDGGRFALCTFEEALDVRAPGLAIVTERDVNPWDGTRALAVAMWPTQRFTGRVVDEHGAPRAGVEIDPVIADPGDRAGSPGAGAATTDPDGRFAIDLPDPDAPIAHGAGLPTRYELWAHVAGRFATIANFDHAVAAASPIAITLGDADLIDPDPVVIAARVRGRVVRDGRPVGDGWVDAGRVGVHMPVTRTRSDGSFELTLEASQLGDLQLEAAGPGGDVDDLTVRRVRVRAGQTVQLGPLPLGR